MKITQSEPVETTKSVGLITFMTLSKTVKDLINKCLENGGGYLIHRLRTINNRINLTDLNDKMPTFKIKMKRLFLTLNKD